YTLPVRYDGKLPRSGKKLLGLGDEFALADFSQLDGAQPSGELRLAWNERGLGVSVELSGKKQPPTVDRNAPENSDGLRLFIDTRNTQNTPRASRYCHQFFLLPAGGGREGSQPVCVQTPILRAREETPQADTAQVKLAAVVSKTGYALEA